MHVRDEKVPNDDIWITIPIYECDNCGEYLHDSYPRFNREIEDGHYCGECAFILGEIDEKTYLKYFSYHIAVPCRAYIEDGKVIVTLGRYTPYDRPKSHKRSYPEYSLWRTSVFERDYYTCQHCGRVGGDLNAHHIRSYKEYPELRTTLSNGITLCESCHRLEHKRLRKENRSGSDTVD